MSSLFKTYKKSEDYEEFQTTGIRIPLKAYNAMIYDDNLFTPTPESSEWSKPIISRLAVTLFQYQQITKTDDDDSHQRIQISLISLPVKIYTFSVSLMSLCITSPFALHRLMLAASINGQERHVMMFFQWQEKCKCFTSSVM